MKQILLMIAVVALVGCGKSKEETSQKSESPKAAPEKLITDSIVEKAVRENLYEPPMELTKADLEKMTKLYLAEKKLTKVPKSLEKLTMLEVLQLDGNRLTDVKGLENLTQLRELWLQSNRLTDVKGLENLTQLRELHLAYNQLTDVKGLEKLTQLRLLNLLGNPDLTKAQIAQLRKTLPNCKIYCNLDLTK